MREFLVLITFNLLIGYLESELLNMEKNLIIHNSKFLISSSLCNAKTQCISKCLKNSNCGFVIYKDKSCDLFTKLAWLYRTPSTNDIIHKRILFSKNLKYYWPIENLSLEEIITQANFINKEKWSFTEDRFNSSNSAIELNGNHLVLEPRIYFNDDFTVMVWAKVNELILESSLFGCLNGLGEGVHINFLGGKGKAYYAIYSKGSAMFLDLVTDLKVGVWYHFIISLENRKIAYFYLNGKLEKIGQGFYTSGVNRTSCFFGGHSTRAVLDDMKMFNKALSITEIQNEMKN
ncbi:unnamed protein product [Brachionus calyciflorus]|uniref:Apple domain-containing protein n=1 Tax=Brachionus calyciflorus TaxID=104777 RepID=A0A814MRD2_9BILA|nr:unnamed protein product [Brachionus calyciflorus]